VRGPGPEMDAADYFAQQRLGWPEKEFQSEVLQLLRDAGYTRIYHTYFSDRSEKGFPDVFALGPGLRPLFAELKSMRGKLSREQEEWGEALREAGEAFFVWRPCCWNSGELQAAIAGMRR